MKALSQSILLLGGWRRAMLAFVIGAVSVLALAPFHLFVILFATFPVLVWLLDGAVGDVEHGLLRRLWPAFTIGWWFGFGYFIAGTWWLSNALLVEAPEFAWAIPLAVLGLPALLGIFYGLATALARTLWSDGIGRVAALAACFGLAEWLRSFALTGFPWNTIGYALLPTPVFMQVASVLDLFAISALAVFIFALGAGWAGSRFSKIASTSIIVSLLVAQAGFGYWRLATQMPVTNDSQSQPVVRLVQPAIDQTDKLNSASATEVFDRLLALTELPSAPQTAQSPQIIIWPETAVPFVLTREPDALAQIARVLDDGQILLTGAAREEIQNDGETRRYYNSLLAVDSEGVIIAAADKTHLVPFGEYLPFADTLKGLGLETIAAADRGYSAAPRLTPIKVGPFSIVPLICYEAVFPALIANVPGDSDVLINVTNDAWFGNTPGPRQHFHQARLRAVESGIPMIRVANNGISAAIDAAGRITGAIGFDQSGITDITLPKAAAVDTLTPLKKYNFWLIIVSLFILSMANKALDARSKQKIRPLD